MSLIKNVRARLIYIMENHLEASLLRYYLLGRPQFVRTKHIVRYYRNANLYLVGFKFDHQNVHNVITTCMYSSIADDE
jgi:hypothetical protein